MNGNGAFNIPIVAGKLAVRPAAAYDGAGQRLDSRRDGNRGCPHDSGRQFRGAVAAHFAAGQSPPENVLLGNTHTHNSIRVDGDGVHIILPGPQKFVDRIMAATERAVKEAVANLRVARAGYAVGEAHLIANRNEWFPAQHRYIDGIDRSGNQPVDASLAVLEFETPSGEPIAFVLNYGIEPVASMASPTDISGDVPGAASRYIEDKFADKAVALFTIGPAASPLYRVRPGPQTRCK